MEQFKSLAIHGGHCSLIVSIKTTTIQTADGPQYILKLHADLITIYHVQGRHTGEHLAEAFFQVLDQIGITFLQAFYDILSVHFIFVIPV